MAKTRKAKRTGRARARKRSVKKPKARSGRRTKRAAKVKARAARRPKKVAKAKRRAKRPAKARAATRARAKTARPTPPPAPGMAAPPRATEVVEAEVVDTFELFPSPGAS